MESIPGWAKAGLEMSGVEEQAVLLHVGDDVIDLVHTTRGGVLIGPHQSLANIISW